MKEIEEVAEKNSKFHHRDSFSKNIRSQGFKEGIEWYTKRSYTEDEAGELVYNILGEYAKHYGIMIDGAKLNELFEQFKKK
jgi:hypothetical protein